MLVGAVSAVPVARWRIGAIAGQFNTRCLHLPRAGEHAVDPHPSIQRQLRSLHTDKHGVVRQRHINAAHHQMAVLPALYQALDHRIVCPANERQARIGAALVHVQLAAGPMAAHQHFLRRAWVIAELEPLEIATAIHRADGTGLLEAGRPVDAAGHHFATSIAQPADPHGIPRTQAGSDLGTVGQAYRLPHDAHRHGVARQGCQRAFVGVQDRNAPGLQTTPGIERFHGNHLAYRQAGTGAGDAVLADRNVFVEVHFHAIDADRGEPGDGADNAGATDSSVIVADARATHSACNGTGAANAARALFQWCAGTTDPAVVGVDAGTAHAARCCARAAGATRCLDDRHFAGARIILADTGWGGLQHTCKPEAQNEGDCTNQAQFDGHGSGAVGELGSEASV
ncbi:hypothetical protein D3C75_388100 [compost metagenome]